MAAPEAGLNPRGPRLKRQRSPNLKGLKCTILSKMTEHESIFSVISREMALARPLSMPL